MEFRALLYGMEAIPDGCRVSVFIDNTSNICTIRKQRSNIFIRNKILEDIFKLATQKTLVSIDINYINTKLNLADGPSRWFASREQLSSEHEGYFSSEEWQEVVSAKSSRISAPNVQTQ